MTGAGIWPRDLLARDFAGKRVLITGASRGIGAAVAAAFAAFGARLALHGSAPGEALRASAARTAEIGGAPPVTLTGDFRRAEDVERVVAAASESLGGLDVLINNAGTMLGRRPAAEIAAAAVDDVLALNARSVTLACRAALPALARSPAAAIVNTSSISARSGGSPGSAVYSAAKAYVATLTRALASEWAPLGIRVNAVAPGTIATDFHRRYSSPEKLAATAARLPLRRLGTPEDCVGAYLFLASPSLSGYVTGQSIEVNGGALMP